MMTQTAPHPAERSTAIDKDLLRKVFDNDDPVGIILRKRPATLSSGSTELVGEYLVRVGTLKQNSRFVRVHSQWDGTAYTGRLFDKRQHVDAWHQIAEGLTSSVDYDSPRAGLRYTLTKSTEPAVLVQTREQGGTNAREKSKANSSLARLSYSVRTANVDTPAGSQFDMALNADHDTMPARAPVDDPSRSASYHTDIESSSPSAGGRRSSYGSKRDRAGDPDDTSVQVKRRSSPGSASSSGSGSQTGYRGPRPWQDPTKMYSGPFASYRDFREKTENVEVEEDRSTATHVTASMFTRPSQGSGQALFKDTTTYEPKT